MTKSPMPVFLETRPHVEVVVGVLSGVFREDKSGNLELVPFYDGLPRVFVEFVDEHGERRGLWEGSDHAAAIYQAGLFAQSLGVSVIDASAGVACQ